MAESVQLPEDIQRRLNTLTAAGALFVCAIYGWFAIAKNVQVPLLVFLDIAVHEVGHLLFSPFGDLVMLIMGTGFQILFPFAAGIVFAIWGRNLIAWGVCWAWAANAMCDGARYIYDAPRGELMLMGAGDGLGDWAKDLGPRALRQGVPGRPALGAVPDDRHPHVARGRGSRRVRAGA